MSNEQNNESKENVKVIAEETATDILVLTEFSKVLYRPSIHAGSITAVIPFDGTVCQLDVFIGSDDIHQVCEDFSVPTVGIQFVKSFLQIVILRITDFTAFWFVSLLLRSQHRHPLLSRVDFHEPYGFCHTRSCVLESFQFLLVFRLEAIPPRTYWVRFTGTVPPLSLR